MPRDQEFDRPPKDIRLGATIAIWVSTLFMVCNVVDAMKDPVVAGTEITAIPIMALLFAGISTGIVWFVGAKKTQSSFPEARIQQLEERLANLETIASHEENNLQTKVRQLRGLE